MEPFKVVHRRHSRMERAISALAILAFAALGLWAAALVRHSWAIQSAFNRANAQSIELTELLDDLTKLNNAGSEVLQSYAVGYQRIVYEKTFEQFEIKRSAPRIPWDASCEGCLVALDEAVRAHRAQAGRVFDVGERWEALPPGLQKERVRKEVADALFVLEQRQEKALSAFQDLEAANRVLLTKALREHQQNARILYAFAGVTLFLALAVMAFATFARIQAWRSRVAENLMSTLMNVVPDGIIVWDDARHVVQANPAACALLATAEAGVAGRLVTTWVPQEICERLESPACSSGVQFTMPFQTPSAPLLEASAGSLRLGEESVRVGIFRDISKRVEAERKMREAQKMEALGALAAGVVHDVKNLLAPISLAEEMLSRDPDLTPSKQGLLHKIRKSAEVASNLMNQLLRLARKEAETPLQAVDVHACIKDTLALIRHNLGPDISIETRLLSQRPDVKSSYERLVQVFSNLFINASQAMRGKGVLRVETSDADGLLIIQVADTGEGMTPEIQERIFEPLFTTKGEQGTGLGLFNVKHAVDEMGGHIAVSSVPGRGTEFTVQIPSV